MTISFSELGRYGRLGNQMFQVASTIGIAERFCGTQAVFPTWKYEEFFETPIPHGPMNARKVNEQFFEYYQVEAQDNCDLHGYFQSWKYFSPNFRFCFKESLKQRLRKQYEELFSQPTICIHIRRGDYVSNPNYVHLPVTWFITALFTEFPNWRECNILVLSDDREYAKIHFDSLPGVFFPDENSLDIEDMCLGSMCDEFIISNSTFGWWMAYLANNNGKVVRPPHMFNGKLKGYSTKDFWLEEWTIHEKENYRLDLTDMTFTIPLNYDHPDRKQNLGLSLCLLQMDLDSNYILMEQGGNAFAGFKKFGVKYMTLDSSVFHRTRMLNLMAKEANTRYIANWDCDVIIPPLQIWTAVDVLRNGWDMVYPFDGRFARMQRDPWFKRLQQSLDIGIVGKTPFKGKEQGHNSAGGAVFFNKASFFRGGGENERMISFGPEDWERYHRFQTLGYTIGRVNGALFHLNHFIGKNSSSMNPAFKKNHAEFEKVKAMPADELMSYIKTWNV